MKPRPYSPRKTLAALVVFGVLVMFPYLRAAYQARAYAFSGATMGTTYTVKLAPTRTSPQAVRRIQERVEARLDALTRQMSTYEPESEISRFNRLEAGSPFAVSRDFATVAEHAVAIAGSTGGAFDPTVQPLVELWGFGARLGRDHRPPEADIAAARAAVGVDGLSVDGASLTKQVAALRLDLSAIAKGYAVDCVADVVTQAGCSNVFVDIGGEIVARGESAPGEPWRVAVETPVLGSTTETPEFRRLELRDAAVATSGDYRHYFEEDGVVYTHVIDPRTGYPVSNGVASVTVIAADCMTADAYATALMVMGVSEGIDLVERLPGLEALMITRRPDGTYATRESSGFPR